MSQLLNRVKANTATIGIGTVNLGSAVSPFQTWSSGGAVSGLRYSLLIEDGVNWEISEGVYTSGSPDTMTRNLVASSTGSLLNLSGSATVACVSKALDVPQVIEKKLFTGAETSFTFSNIPQNFSCLELEFYGRTTNVSGVLNLPMTVNGNTSAIYSLQRLYSQSTGINGDQFLSAANMLNMVSITGANYPAGYASGFRLRLPGYSQTSLFKAVNAETYSWPNATGSPTNHYVLIGTTIIGTTTAITSIESGLVGNAVGGGAFVAGSYAVLRGIP